MRTLVTGGAGFIGSHLVNAYLANGDEVLVLDDLTSGDASAIPPEVELIVGDVADALTAKVILHARPDLVIHAAAQTSVQFSMDDPARDRAVNLMGTANMVGAAKDAGVRRFVFISSGGAIYGEADGADESWLAAPQNFYGVHKWAAERYLELSGISYGIARPSNVYGSRQRAGLEGGVVAIFASRAASGKALTIYGSGEQSRDFLHVDDVVDAIVRIGSSDLAGFWNVATGVATTINQLATIVEGTLGTPLGREFAGPRLGEVGVSRLRADRIAADLGWRPTIDLETGVSGLLHF
jgi:UDP-glucose 4-epimerase